MKEEYTRRLSSARDEADLLVRSAVEEANRRGDEIVGDARQTAAGIKRKAEDEIAQERLKAYSELKNDISGYGGGDRRQNGRPRDQRGGSVAPGGGFYSECGG